MKRVCIIGCGAIGSLYAAHLARVVEVWAFVRRENHARALNREGLAVSGRQEFHVRLHATADPDELPPGVWPGYRGFMVGAGSKLANAVV